MSELKVYDIDLDYPYNENNGSYYLKSEADKEIQRLEKLCENYRCDCDNLAIMTDTMRKAASTLRQKMNHQKYKRCLAMAERCDAEADVADADGDYEDMRWYQKWHNRWMELAEKFKPNNSTAQ